MEIVGFRHKALARFYERGDRSKLDSQIFDKLSKMLLFLDGVDAVDEIKAWPLWKADQLSDGRWSFHVTANFRLTFLVDDRTKEISAVDLEDYH